MSEENKKELTINSWEVEDALRTIIRAEEIKQDAKLFELVAKKAATQKQALDNLTSRANTLYGNMEDKK